MAEKNKAEAKEEENERLRKQIEGISRERDTYLIERRHLQHQCKTAIMKWDDLEKDVSRLRSERERERDQFSHRLSQERTESSKTLLRLRGERDRAAHESRLIMSERDSVLKEIEILQDKVDELSKKLESSEKEKKSSRDEVEILRREIASALHDRDHTLKQINELRERHGDIDLESMGIDADRLGADHNFNRRERLSGTERERKLREDQIKRESMEMTEVVSNENEVLKKENVKLRSELNGKCIAYDIEPL